MKRIFFSISIIFISLCLNAQTLTLDSCLVLAKQNNLQLRNAELEIEKAKQVRMQLITKFFPNIHARAFAFHSLDPLLQLGAQDFINAVSDDQVRTNLNQFYQDYAADPTLDNMFGFFQYGVTAGAVAVQPVFAGGQIVNATRLAKLGIDAAQLKAQIAERDLRLNIEQTYLLIIGLNAKLATLQSVSQLLDTLQTTVNAAIDAGLTTQNDLLQLQIKQSETEQLRMQVENGLLLSKQALASYIGIPYSDSLVFNDTLAFRILSDSLPRPEKQLLQLNIRSQQLQKYIEIGKSLPQIAIGGSYTFNRFLQDRNQHNGLLFATVKIPITDWWETGHKIRQMNLQTEQARNENDYLNEQMQLQALQAEQTALLVEKQIRVAAKTIESAEENLRIARLNYNAGMITISDLLEAQTLLSQAQNNLTDAQLNLYLAQQKAQDYK